MLLFLIGIDLDVMVGDGFLVKDEPDTLDEGTKPAAIEGEILRCGRRWRCWLHKAAVRQSWGGVDSCEGGGSTCGTVVDGSVHVSHGGRQGMEGR